LEAGSPQVPGLLQAISLVNCPKVEFVGERTCSAILDASYIWAGETQRHVSASPWHQWAVGLAQLEARSWSESAASLSEAAKTWSSHPAPGNLTELLSPKPDVSLAYAKLGYAQFMLGQFDTAIGSLDRALFAKPGDAGSLFLRARAREELGLPHPALVDFEAAAKSNPLAAAVLLFRQGKTQEAATAFANLPDSAPDLDAWKLLTAGCSSPSDRLTEASLAASPVFPKREAAGLVLDCSLKAAATLPELIALDPHLRSLRDAESHDRVSNAYLKIGLAAEDRQNNAEAASAYQHSLDWSPSNTKARFNLASLYIGDKKFDQAEREFREILANDPGDHEAQFWLAQSILVTGPEPGRKAEACGLLQRALQIPDAARRSEMSTVAAAACPP
jgi:tetratricopeptide (TPR) repeat protein